MQEHGWYLRGYYVGVDQRTFKAKDGNGYDDVYNVMIVVDATAYRIRVDEDQAVSFETLSIGANVLVRCRPYVGNNGKMGITGGELMESD